MFLLCHPGAANCRTYKGGGGTASWIFGRCVLGKQHQIFQPNWHATNHIHTLIIELVWSLWFVHHIICRIGGSLSLCSGRGKNVRMLNFLFARTMYICCLFSAQMAALKNRSGEEKKTKKNGTLDDLIVKKVLWGCFRKQSQPLPSRLSITDNTSYTRRHLNSFFVQRQFLSAPLQTNGWKMATKIQYPELPFFPRLNWYTQDFCPRAPHSLLF